MTGAIPLDGVLRAAVIEHFDPNEPSRGFRAVGRVYGHRRFSEGTPMQTSRIITGPDPQGRILTRNGIYRLEMKDGK